MALYPPLVNSSLPAFSADTQQIKFYFSIPKTMNEKDIEASYLQYTIVNQKNNQSVLNTANMNNKIGVISKQDIISISGSNMRYFFINSSDIYNGWTPGTIYKVQIRFQKNDGETSEWSTVCYLKATGNSEDIVVDILNSAENSFSVYIDSPEFYGIYRPAESDDSEIQKKYRFTLIDYSSNNIIEDTGWQTHIEGSTDKIIFSRLLENCKRYYLEYSIETKNKYIKTIKKDFICIFDLFEIPDIQFIKLENNIEEGYIEINLKSEEKMSTNLILRRTDSKTNFAIWEDYKIFNIWDESININFYDYLIEHGVEYKYSIQLIQTNGYRSQSIYSPTVLALYEHMFLVGDNNQLKIKFNPKISSWKRVLQEAKVDTIGSKYPFITRNGNVNYSTFPINGLISYHMDEGETFCLKNSLCVSNQITAAIADNHNRIGAIDDWSGNTNLDDINIVLEREFRNQVEEFLTNGNYKYFKSPTEGTKLIALTGVSLSPEETLGRMIYSFSSTAYEVGDNNLSNLVNLNIINSGEYINSKDMGEKLISGVFSKNITNINENIYTTIKNKTEGVVENTNYIRKLKYIKNLQIEVLNDIDCTISIQQEENGSWTDILISKNLGYYIIPEIVHVYGFKCKTINAKLNISYIAICYYEEKSSSSNISYNAQAVSKFTQLYTTFKNELNNMDLFIALLNANRNLDKIYSLSYLSIEAPMGTQIEINGELITLDGSGFKEFNNIVITSAKMVTETIASISVVYNGVIFQ